VSAFMRFKMGGAFVLPVQITTNALPNGEVGQAYSFQLAAQYGLQPYSWSIVSVTDPNSWSLSPSGLLTGTPTNAETDSITFQVTDALNGTAQRTLLLTVINPLAVTTSSPLPGAVVGTGYSDTLAASGGIAPYTWSLVSHSGTNAWAVSAVGAVTGTPTTAETDSLVVQVADSASNTAQKSFSLPVYAALQITTASPLPGATTGQAYSDGLVATGGLTPYTWSLISQTGSNSWVVSTGGVVSGTPENAETDSLVIQVADSAGHTAQGTFQLSVAQAGGMTFDYYISPTGSNSNPGTLGAPWAISALNSLGSTYRGKTIGLIEGVYGVYTLWESASYNAPALNVTGGTAASPTYIASCDTNGVYSPRAAQITASPSGTPGGGYPGTTSSSVSIIGQGYSINTGYVTFDGLAVSDSSGYLFWVQGGSSGNFTIKNCLLYNVQGSEGNNPGAIYQLSCVGNLITNNVIYNCQLSGGGNHNMAGIFGQLNTGNTYSYNTIYNCNSDIYDKNSTNGGHTYAYNYFECNGSNPQNCVTNSAGGTVGETRTVHHNVFVIASGSTNILLGQSDLSPGHNPYESLLFYNNTIYVLSNGSFQGGVTWQSQGNAVNPPGAVTHYNNIYVSNGAGSLGTVDWNTAAGAVTLCDYNAYVGCSTHLATGTSGVPGTTYSLSTWQSSLGYDEHGIAPTVAAVNFSNPGQAQLPSGYTLGGGSACSGSGSTNGTTSGAACDMGAYGYDPATGQPNTQVGANWTP
jgi:hypothetical protein